MRKAAMLIGIVVALLFVCYPQANAYETYSTDRNTTNCAACHGNFRTGTYASQVDGSSWGTNLHDAHRTTMLNSDCNVCHSGASRFPVVLNVSSGTAPFNTACVSCHGRPGEGGAGLRQHHYRAGETVCASCHSDANPASFTVAKENVQPAGYFTPDPAHPNKPTNACNTGGAETRFGSSLGLDNDGDLLYDAGDPDCAPAPTPAPSISLNPAALNFGTVTTGSSVSLPAQVQNTGTAVLNVTGITRTAGTSTEYTWSPSAPFSVAAGGATTLTVTYAPTALGTDSGSLTIASNDAAKPTVTLTLQGSASTPAMPSIALSPASLAFGNVTVGNSSTLTTQIQNNGTANLNVTNIARCAGTSTEYAGTFPTLPFTVAPGANATLSVAYTPTNGGLDSGCMQVSSNDPATANINLALSGTGVVQPPSVPVISLSPASLSFGNVNVGSSASLSGQVRNTGTANLIVSGITACTGTSTEFTGVFPTLPFTVAPGANAAFTVAYTPTNGGSDSGCINFTSNASATPVALNLSGTGIVPPPSAPVISLNPSSLSFGNVTIGSSVTKSSQIQNTGSANLSVTGISRCGGTSTEFTWSSPALPFTVAPGASTALMVSYAPTAAGTDSGCITVASNDPASPSTNLGVQGTGQAVTPPPPQPGSADIDIKKFEVKGDYELPGESPIALRFEVINTTSTNGDAVATLKGVQNGTEIYNKSITVSVPARKVVKASMPSYQPVAGGTISWTLTLEDANPDTDAATATTAVKAPKMGDREEREEEEEDD